MAKPTIIELEFLAIFNKAVDEFQSSTGYALERQDAERLMIQVFSNMVYHWGSQWREASLQNFLEYMSGEQLDAYGESNDVPRLTETPSGCFVRVNFIAALESFYPIHKNTIFTGKNDNGTFTFKTNETWLASPEDTYIDVWVNEFLDELTNSGALANGIEIGDVDTLEDPDGIYTLVDSVENIGETYGGHASENDDHYKARLAFVLGKPSTAGAFDAYVYHSLTASVKVLDVGIIKPYWEIHIYVLPYDFEIDVIGDSSSQVSNLALTVLPLVETDYGRLYWTLTGSPTRTFSLFLDSAKTVKVAEYVGANGVGLTLVSEPGYTVTGTVDLTGSTDDQDVANVIETYVIAGGAVDQVFNPSTGYPKARPMNDIVKVYMIQETTFTISKCDVQIRQGNVETAKTAITQVVNAYRDSLRSKAGKNAVRGDLDGMIRDIGGIYDTDIEFDSDPTKKVVEALESQYLSCALPTINVTVYTP